MSTTYKQIYIKAITREILKRDKEKKDASLLRIARKKAMSLHGKLFVPTRFPDPKYLSISLIFNANEF